MAAHTAQAHAFPLSWPNPLSPRCLSCRGRAYPINDYMTHLQDDISRGLLEFGEGKPLGPDGLNWLLIKVGVDAWRVAVMRQLVAGLFSSSGWWGGSPKQSQPGYQINTRRLSLVALCPSAQHKPTG